MSSLTRRSFLKSCTGAAALAGAFPYVSARNVLGANSRLNVAGIGTGGRGRHDILGCKAENVIAICDVDSIKLADTGKLLPDARCFADWRVMFDEMSDEIDAVTVSTPDHMHFLPARRALLERKHLFCQKPLTHAIWEARELTRLAREAGVATQMGNQGVSHFLVRREAELFRAGVLGDILEFHCWTDRPGEWFKQGLPRPTEFPPVPATLNWDLWLGGAAERPYHPSWAHTLWRGWWDFGTGPIGDMGCHLLNTMALAKDIRDPIHVVSDCHGGTEDSGPLQAHITWKFPARNGQPAWTMHWYDAGLKPPADLFPTHQYTNNGQIIIGTKDTFFSRGYNGGGIYKSGARNDDFAHIPETMPKPRNWDQCHYDEWLAACKGGPAAMSNFTVAGPVTEVVLLGQLASRLKRPIDWDAANMRATNVSEASRFVRPEYRKGWV